MSILKAIVVYGKQAISYRGHLEYGGTRTRTQATFPALLEFHLYASDSFSAHNFSRKCSVLYFPPTIELLHYLYSGQIVAEVRYAKVFF